MVEKKDNKKISDNIVMILVIGLLVVCSCVYLIIQFKNSSLYKDILNMSNNVEKPDDIIDNPYIVTNDYDGVYYFEEIGYNDANYKFISKGIISFDNGSINVKYLHNYKGVLSYKKFDYEEDSGVFGYEKDDLKILFKDGDRYRVLAKDGQLYLEKNDDSHFTGGCILKEDVLLQYKGKTDTLTDVWNQFIDEMLDEELLFFENIRWNMSDEELASVVGYTMLNSSVLENKGITYKTIGRSEEMNKYQFDNTVLIFKDNQFKAYFMQFNYNNTYDNYLKVKELLEKNYGKPSSEKYIWKDEAYKEEPDKWNDAFKYSDFSIKMEWTNVEDFTLVVTWDYEHGSSIAYCEKGYEVNL